MNVEWKHEKCKVLLILITDKTHLETDGAAGPTRYCEVTPLTLQSRRSIMTHRKLIFAAKLLMSLLVILGNTSVAFVAKKRLVFPLVTVELLH